MQKLTHLNESGEAHMVDVSAKANTDRIAVAESNVVVNPELMDALSSGTIPKGDVLATARIAGIQAAKKCSDLIPLCHPLPLNKVSIDIELLESSVSIQATCKTSGKTGVGNGSSNGSLHNCFNHL